MKIKRVIPLHHAYLISGGREEATAVRDHILEEVLEVIVTQNPDVLFEVYETFGIEESRVLKERHVLKPLSGKKVSIMEIGSMTPEAMHGLLKLLEEPAAEHHFIIIMSDASTLIPTFLSRVFHIALAEGDVVENGDEAQVVTENLGKALHKARLKKNSKRLGRVLGLISAIRMRGTSEKQIGDLSKILLK